MSDHPPALISAGQTYVTSLIDALMQSPDWTSTAIFLAWDDWGGFYDHVVPPTVDGQGYGLRVPGLLISPYAPAGLHRPPDAVSFDAYLKFIEDDFLGGQRLDPEDRRPARPAADRAREREGARQPPRRVRLHPAPRRAEAPPAPPALQLTHSTFSFASQKRLLPWCA